MDNIDKSTQSSKSKVLDLIRREGAISRSEIARRTRLSLPTVSRIINSLVDHEKLVMEAGTDSSVGGRPASLIEFAGSHKYVIGVDLTTDATEVVIANLNAEFIAQTKTPTNLELEFPGLVAQTCKTVHDLINNSHLPRNDIFGIGLALAGIVNVRKGTIESSAYLRCHEVDVAAEFKRNTDLPVFFDTQARAMAIGELQYGVGRDYDDFICLNIGEGIGAGIVLNRQLFYGQDGLAGEFGHTVIDRNSERWCRCGNYGCLEAIASGAGLVWTVKNSILAGANSLLSAGHHINDITSGAVVEAAQFGDSVALQAVKEAADAIALGAVNLVHLFGPQALIIGGPLVNAGDLLFQPIRKTLEERIISKGFNTVTIKQATHAEKSILKGAVALISSKILDLTIFQS